MPIAAVLAGCGSVSTTSTTTSSASPTTSSSAVATGAAATGSVAALAQAFYATLDAEQRKGVLLDCGLASAARWSNLPQALLGGAGSDGFGGDTPPSSAPDGGGTPPSGAPGGGTGGGLGGGGNSPSRVGISIGDLTDDQLAAFATMIKAATGTTAGPGYDEITQHLDALRGRHAGGPPA